MHKIRSYAKRLMCFLAILLPVLLAGCGGHWNGPTLTAIAVAPANPSIPKAAVKQYTATAIYSDGTSTDITGQATWTSSNGAVATVTDRGLATGLAVGVATITGSYQGQVASTSLTVTPALLMSIAVAPATPGIVKGLTGQFTALGIYSDGTSQNLTSLVNWASGDPTIAAFNANGLASSGLATGLNVGSTVASATFGGKTGNVTLTVTAAVLNSIAVTPATPTIVKGLTGRFTATGIYSDGTSSDLTAAVNWSSGSPSIATMNGNGLASSGLATGVNAGQSVISASFGSKTGSATLTVSSALLNSIVVAPATMTIVNGQASRLTALGIFNDGTSADISGSVVWASGNTTVAIMNPNGLSTSGQATGVGAGVAVISASFSGKIGNASLTVNSAALNSIVIAPVASTIVKGLSGQLTALGIYNDGTSADLTASVTWSSSDTNIATMNPNGLATSGLATGVTAGSVVISAGFAGKNATTTLNVSSAVLRSISVITTTPSIVKGQKGQFTALGIFNDGTSSDITTSVVWASNDTSVATMNANGQPTSGQATGINAGPAIISALFGGKTGSTGLTVTPAILNAISVSPLTADVVKGLTSQFTALGIYSDGTSQPLTSSVVWASETTAVATMNANGLATSGLATGVAAGTSVISATFGGKTGLATLTVAAASLSSITVTPATPSIVKGLTGQFTAMGTYNDGSSSDITSLVTWSSGDTSVATMNANGLATSGLATGAGAGTSLISASLGGKTGIASINVTAATLVSIGIAPASPTVVKGLTVQFTALGTYNDSTSKDLTASVVWASDDTNIAALNANGTAASGLATGLGAGTTGITALFGGKTGNATITVTAATLTAITIAPVAPSIPKGQTNQFLAMGTYNNGTSADLTSVVTWASLNTAVATLNQNLLASSGLATAVSAGTAGITATFGTKTGHATLNVTPINLGLAAKFGNFGGTAGVTNSGTTTVITGSNGNTGDVGTIATATSSVTGIHDSAPSDIYTESPLNIGSVTGKIYTCTNSTTGPTSAGVNAASCRVANQGFLAAQSAYADLVAMPIGPLPDQGAGSLANLVLAPGVYTAAGGSFKIQGGDLTLDAQGDPNAVWVFQMATTLTVGGPGAAFPQSVILVNGGQAKNVFWQVGSFATINAGGGGTMVGTIISQAGASFSTAGNVTPVVLNGRVLSLGGSVTMVDTLINVPAP